MWDSREIAGMTLWTSAALSAAPGLVHAFTGAGSNMSTSQGPGGAAALRHRATVCEYLELRTGQLTFGEQVHGAEIVLVGDASAGNGRAPAGSRVPHVDGLVTDVPGVPLMALSADCPAVLIYHPAGDGPVRTRDGLPGRGRATAGAGDPDTAPRAVVGLAHAGWRGAIGGIAARLIDVMVERYGCERTRMLAGISPSAGPCCYEVKEDVVRLAAMRWPRYGAYFSHRHERVFLNLRAALSAQLAAGGIEASRQCIARCCTICDERFFSYRRDGAKTGHAALIAGIRVI
jgi:hypothetical protein